MRMLVLTAAASLAAIALVAAPAEAQSLTAKPGAGTGVFIHGDFGRDVRHGDRRRHRRDVDLSVGTWVNGGEWARWNNRSFQSDSYNDWWHDRPDRAYPRWMQSNQNCERMWWGGGGWRC